MSFARTKIQPPRPRAGFIERSQLQSDLGAALASRRAVLLCAPAGYGKTTLLAQAMTRLSAETATAWVSADEGDDLPRLLECMLAALEPLDPPWRSAPESLVGRVVASEDERNSVAAEIINALDACNVAHGVLVFDDVHRVDDPPFFAFLDRLLARLSGRWTIALSSRIELPMALARWRAADELAEFRQVHLQFARDEACRLAHDAGIDGALADRLFARTQGWPAGLRLAIGAHQGAANQSVSPERVLRASERSQFDFLVSEVLDQLPPALAQFLLRVSVLPELQAERCATVAQDPWAAKRLDEVERLGLFVDVLDAPTPTLRLHDLFRDALKHALQQRDPDRFRVAQRLAATTELDPIRRIGLLLDAGEVEQAAAGVFAHVPAMIAVAGTASASNLISRFPPDVQQRSPELHFVRGSMAWVHWDFLTMLSSFEQAEAGFAARSQRDSELLARSFRAIGLIAMGEFDQAAALLASLDVIEGNDAVRAMALHGRSWLAVDLGELKAVAPLIDQMLDRLERADRMELWYHTTTANRLPGLPGMTQPLRRHAALLFRLCRNEPSTLRALAYLVQGWEALWRGAFDEALQLGQRAREDAEWSGWSGAVRGHLLALTALREAALGNAAAALEVAELRSRELGVHYGDWGRWMFHIFVARTAAISDDVTALQEALQRVEANLRPGAPAGTHMIVALQAQRAWLEGQKDEAISRWRAALANEEALEVWGVAPETRVRLARALLRRGDLESAADTLRPVFERAEREGGPGGAVLAGEALRELLAARWANALSAAHIAQLQAWAQMLAAARLPEPPSACTASTPALSADPMTAREREVLARIAAGDSNKQIARLLGLSPHTVKRHVANILGKLGVDTRGQAAAHFRNAPH